MPILKWLFIKEKGEQQSSTSCHSLVLISRGSHLILVEKSSLALKWQILKVTLTHFSTILLHKCQKKNTSTFKFCYFKASEDFSTKIKWKPLDINANKWQEVDDCCYPFSVMNSHFKKGIYVLSLYWGINTPAYQCTNTIPKDYYSL